MIRKLTLLVLMMALALSACAPAGAPVAAPAEQTAITLTDGLGREISLAAPAQRIVSLAPSNTEILFAVGAGAQTVGRDEFSDYPEKALGLPSVGGSFGEYSLEQIVALEPDLVLAAEINTPELVQSLEDLGLTVFYLKNPTTLEEMYGNLETVALLTGHSEETAALVDSLKARVAAVDEKIAPLSSRFAVFYEIDATDPAKPYTAGKGTFITLLLERAGAYNVAGELEGYPQLSLEQLVAYNPQVILLGDAAWGVTVESVGQRPGWETLAAVQNNQIFAFDDNLVSRPGPRLVDGLETLAKLLRPDLFK